jgi:hypothetical protein
MCIDSVPGLPGRDDDDVAAASLSALSDVWILNLSWATMSTCNVHVRRKLTSAIQYFLLVAMVAVVVYGPVCRGQIVLMLSLATY